MQADMSDEVDGTFDRLFTTAARFSHKIATFDPVNPKGSIMKALVIPPYLKRGRPDHNCYAGKPH